MLLMMYRTLLLIMGGAGLVGGIFLVFAVASTWANTRALEPAATHLEHFFALNELNKQLRDAQAGPGVYDEVSDALRTLLPSLARTAPERADEIARVVVLFEGDDPARDRGRALLEEVIEREGDTYRALVARLSEDAQRALNATVALAIVLPVFAVALFAFLHRRVLQPLQALSGFLNQLARKEFVVVDPDGVDPMLRPVFQQYSRMVRRMHDLEAAHNKREDSLELEVEQATRTLFQQQARLGRAERMAAVGEVAARLSHELRNPLSSILMVLTNLRNEADDGDDRQRLDLAIGELQRMARVLSRVLDKAKLAPEPPDKIILKPMVDELLALVRYQIDDAITLENQVTEDVCCRLPEPGLRQCLLNLVLNAARASRGRRGRIRVRDGYEDGRFAIQVLDDGPGFPATLLESGVHEFGSWQSDGSGLGLATARRFAFANGGRLDLTNLDDGGACASLEFPADVLLARATSA